MELLKFLNNQPLTSLNIYIKKALMFSFFTMEKFIVLNNNESLQVSFSKMCK